MPRLRDALKISRKTFFNPTGWIDYNSLKNQNKLIWSSVSGLFKASTPNRTETFEAAMERLGLTEEDVRNTQKTYSNYALAFLLLGLLVFLYSFYLLFRHGTFTGWLLGIGATALFWAQAYRYDFWVFQMKRRKLGATFAEWKNHILGIKDHSA